MFSRLAAWLQAHDWALWSLGGMSLLMFVVTLIAVPIIVARIPADYFARPERDTRLILQRHPAMGLLVLILKNLLGLVLLVAGVAMLVLPGQGLLTIVIALTLLNFPGKFQLERWIVSRPPVFGAINWIRRRRGVPKLTHP
ncbi:PGPGW domain-containing protein [Salicola sp. Rm-C-2C1-2]|uniref:PGPGW domain-containing protein n=1 Tax=Salicola sp. Rm-C-2C1-2 TaxID=3141321 RepID=UPI0032E3B4EF